ncbi:MAG: D-alanyl-D-alanine carboxypeptidase DacF [Candidatus Giovannonibacteria bacterium GW2011_GWA2_44_13b]|uniref:D-alanyl-D-alanine carboxypeptidase DacF n=2 Tax=Candidatus Giovannoniibacteriota TaxID=1752738 RepID=A0A0G1H6F9_9BACT|nr:MAG: D-alanyl-D-alanine carboxypeptidase DacF [Candidatus Giovannonibacteria bacterium GW2011_GWA2_44_13b]OGF82793.1 MAG: hypothetical protein A2924_04200 [Candidatus Giovannonibacteria bacterium RIFCSPLOWO2_01_FULL_44_16]
MEKDNLYIFVPAILLFALVLLPSGKTDTNLSENLQANVAEAALVPVPPEVEAKSAYAIDLSSGKIIYEKEKTSALPLASVTKVVSVLVILGELYLDEEVVVSRTAVSTPEPSSLKVGEHFFTRELLAMAMVESSNDAITALVEAAANKKGIVQNESEAWFVNLMNLKANSLNAFTMRFNNPTGLDILDEKSGLPAEAGAFGSAEDLINIAKASIDSELWQFGEITEVQSKEGFVHPLHPTNLLKSEITGLIGGKTGFTDLAGGNLLVIVQHPYPGGHLYGIVVLGSSENGRFEDVKKILEWIKS